MKKFLTILQFVLVLAVIYVFLSMFVENPFQLLIDYWFIPALLLSALMFYFYEKKEEDKRTKRISAKIEDILHGKDY